MNDTVRVKFLTVEVNLLLWILALGSASSAGLSRDFMWPIVVGFVFAAVWQHQAYYRRKREQKAEHSLPATKAP